MFEADLDRDTSATRKSRPLEFVRGFVAGYFGMGLDANIKLWLAGFLLLVGELAQLRSIWLAHLASSSAWPAVWAMICLAVPYSLGIVLLGNVWRLVAEHQITLEVHAKLRSWVSTLVFVTYWILPWAFHK